MNPKSMSFKEFIGFILSPEDSERMRTTLKTEIGEWFFSGTVKTVFWIFMSLVISVLISQLH